MVVSDMRSKPEELQAGRTYFDNKQMLKTTTNKMIMMCNNNQKNYRPDEQRRTSRWQLATLAEQDPCRWRYLLFFFAKI